MPNVLALERSIETNNSEQSDPLLDVSSGRNETAHDLSGYTKQSFSSRLDKNPRLSTQGRGFAAIGLVNPKTPANIGGVTRAARCYSAGLVVLAGQRPWRLAGFATDTQKAWRHIPHILVADVFDAIPYSCIPIAVDLVEDAIDITTYNHPERAFYIFGPEDGTLSNTAIARCKHAIRVPTTYCMNLAAAVNVVLYDRLAKQLRRGAQNP